MAIAFIAGGPADLWGFAHVREPLCVAQHALVRGKGGRFYVAQRERSRFEAARAGDLCTVDTPLRVGPRLTVPASELVERFSRASGPGGQKVNTTDSRVELEWDVGASEAVDDALRARLLRRLGTRAAGGVVRVVASGHRSQLRNREAAADRLLALLQEAMAPPPPRRRPTRPSRAARERRIVTKKQRGQVKRLRGTPEE